MPRIGVRMQASITGLGEFVADVTAIEVAGADSIWLEAQERSTAEWFIELGAIMAVTHRVGLGVIASTPDAPSRDLVAALDTLQRLSGGRALGALRAADRGTLRVSAGRWPGGDAGTELWAEVEVVKDRAAWRNILEANASAGRAGLIVAWDERVVDLLRNPDADDDRSDLLISTG